MEYYIKGNEVFLKMKNRFVNKTVTSFLDSFNQSKKNKYQLIQQGLLKHNFQVAKEEAMLKKDDIISFPYQLLSEEPLIPYNEPLDIVYEDPFLLIVNKQAGLLIHSDGVNTTCTLSNMVQHYYFLTHQKCTVRPIHRLDQDTTGLVVFSKCSFFQPYLDFCLANKEIEREYKAIVEGRIPKNMIIKINKPIGRDRHNSKKRRISNTGKDAYTTVESELCAKNYTLVHCKLKTGRTHQIRVHLSSIHHPILSDSLYGKKSSLIHRCALHAYKIRMIHPISNKELIIHADIPNDMKKLIK